MNVVLSLKSWISTRFIEYCRWKNFLVSSRFIRFRVSSYEFKLELKASTSVAFSLVIPGDSCSSLTLAWLLSVLVSDVDSLLISYPYPRSADGDAVRLWTVATWHCGTSSSSSSDRSVSFSSYLSCLTTLSEYFHIILYFGNVVSQISFF